MKKLLYKKAQIAFKGKDKFVLTDANHVCGKKMLSCAECQKLFCPDCDYYFQPKEAKCCKTAFERYTDDSEVKQKRVREIRLQMEKIKRRKTRSKVKIEEIGNEL